MMSSVSSMGSSVRKLRMNESGISVTSDFSNMTIKESLGEQHFWQILTMITLSLTYAFFMKVCFKSYGSTLHSSDKYLTNVAQVGFFVAALSRFGWAFLQ